MNSSARGRFTGRHMAAIMVAFFAVVIAVNLVMARLAGATFGGVVVDNSYVASQHFNHWLDEAAAQKALGWKADARRAADGRLTITVSGVPEGHAVLTAVARHPLGRAPDRELAFARLSDGRFRSLEALPAGRWRLRIAVQAHNRLWRTEGDVR